MADYGMETSTIAHHEKVRKPAISRKIDAYRFWDSQGPMLEHYQERGSTINSAPYRLSPVWSTQGGIRSRRFTSEQELKEVMHAWLAA